MSRGLPLPPLRVRGGNDLMQATTSTHMNGLRDQRGACADGIGGDIRGLRNGESPPLYTDPRQDYRDIHQPCVASRPASQD